ncbi:MAG: hypothetical protein Q8942_05165 [Bacillota bacterium]|nr:hypothetical protein [Bacillota bacterium]
MRIGIFLNVVGSGQYYDRTFLKELIKIAGIGAVIHIGHYSGISPVACSSIV